MSVHNSDDDLLCGCVRGDGEDGFVVQLRVEHRSHDTNITLLLILE